MKIVSAIEMQSLDKKTIGEFGLSGLVLMERAALGVVNIIIREYSPNTGILVIAGTGNNGGDGLAIARLLFSEQIKVNILLIGKEEKRSEDNLLQLSLVKKLGIPCFQFSEEVFETLAEKSDIIIDSLFGIGLSRLLEGEYKRVISLINSFKGIKIAVDIPSGINADTGEVLGEVVIADHTVTFAYPKTGLLMDQSSDYVGKLSVADIGIPSYYADNIKTNLITREQVSKFIPKRKKSSYKNQFGRLCLIAGSATMSGAAVLAAKAALKSGVGLLNILVPESIHNIVASQVSTAMVIPVKEKDGFIIKDEKILEQYLEIADAVVFGPGIGQKNETFELLEYIIKNFTGSLIIDADGINFLSKAPEILKNRYFPTILTPHAGELSKLLKTESKEIQRNRMEAANKFTEIFSSILVLKGAKTIITQQGKEKYINNTGNPALARGGTGDILTGIIGGLAAQKTDLFEAALAGVYIHGLMADLAIEDLNENSIITEEFIPYISRAFDKISTIE